VIIIEIYWIFSLPRCRAAGDGLDITGSIASQTAVIQRGYKAGTGYRNNGGNGGGNEGGGGSGAYGGNAAVGDGSGGGGGSGYTDGSIAVISTRLGGNNSTNAFARIETFV
jgi:hypothetical protein